MEAVFLSRASAILRRIHSRAPFEQIASEILQSAVEESSSDHGSFVRVDWKDSALRIVATAGQSWTRESSCRRLQVGSGITGKVAYSGLTYCCDDVSDDPYYVSLINEVRSELAIPVMVGERVWGIINLDSTNLAHYDQDTVVRMEFLAEMVASAIGFRLQMEREKELSASLMEAEKHSSMGHLVAGIAHEVNNPLAAILGCAGLLSEEFDDPAVANSVQVIRTQAKRAGDLVKQLLSFSRIGSPEDREKLTISRLISEVDEMVRPSLKMAGVQFESFTEEVGLVCEVNRIQIQQILINLVNNSQQAIVSAGIHRGRITMAARGTDDQILIDVKDNGPGLTQETKERVFDPFFTTKEEGKGTGLGLSISRDIAISHGGQLSYSNGETHGCLFSLSLPRLREDREELSSVTESPVRIRVRKDLRLLIVDDEAPIRWMLKRLLSPLASFCRTAETAEEGMDFAREHQFDVVVSDFHLPGMDGINFYEKANGDRLDRFVLITGDASSPRLESFREKPNVAVLEKPFDLAEIEALIESPLNQRSRAAVALPA